MDIKKWEDLKGKKIGVAPASAVWFQFAAMLKEVGVPYNSFTEIKIQGAAPNAVAALKKGDVDVIVTWEPFELQPVAENFGYWAEGLDYSKSKAVGAELGLISATRDALNTKREAVRRFLWAYLEAVDRLNSSQEEFAKAIAKFQGIDLEVANRMAKNIKLGNFLTLAQMQLPGENILRIRPVPEGCERRSSATPTTRSSTSPSPANDRRERRRRDRARRRRHALARGSAARRWWCSCHWRCSACGRRRVPRACFRPG